jgi:radical SAM protein with 4Fe4S-binding SPASM domain
MGVSGLPRFSPAQTPRTLWIELTSKCPFDCVFCSRKTLRGAGEHLPFPIYESLVRGLADPRRLILNYSGESTVYPELIPAIQLARSAGAYVELVSAFASAPDSLLEPLSRSGLNRLTISLHAADPQTYEEIYRYGSFDAVRSRLERFLYLCGSLPQAPLVDLAFVAMDRNLDQLPAVAALASELRIGSIMIFPVLRRDEIPIQFPSELTADGVHRPEFERRLHTAVEHARARHPEARIAVSQATSDGEQCIGEVPRPYAGPLPEDACVFSCEQNPWETAHVLANGDVVACEVLDKTPLGNLTRQSIREIWNGAPYEQFRERYRATAVEQCRTCAWKKAYRPSALAAEILGSRGGNAQLVLGWHDPTDEAHVWSSQQSMALVAPLSGAGCLHVSGVLPPGPPGDANELTVCCNGKEVGKIANPWEELMPFDLDCRVEDHSPLWRIELRTRHMYRPCERGGGMDQRDLGFALLLMTAKRAAAPVVVNGRARSVMRLKRWIETVDRFGASLRRVRRRHCPRLAPASAGISIVIPERDNPAELEGCLASVREAASRLAEPVQISVVVNGSVKSNYDRLRTAYAEIEWRFHARPLGFAGAVAEGVRRARFDWVYLLNNDAALASDGLRNIVAERAADRFAIASQVFLKDRTRFREETNWTRLFLEDGLVTIHDQIPQSGASVEHFYCGGGASLFQRELLREFLNPAAYEPFYWEDVEWGWRARKLGLRCVFCAASHAHHTQRATISRCYSRDEIDAVLMRNRLLFQLRNLTAAGSLERVLEEIARAPEPVAAFLLSARALRTLAEGRLWNHLAPVSDQDVLSQG